MKYVCPLDGCKDVYVSPIKILGYSHLCPKGGPGVKGAFRAKDGWRVESVVAR